MLLQQWLPKEKEISEFSDLAEKQMKVVIQDMVAFTKDLVVDNDQSFKTATQVYKQARDWKKIIEEKRKAAIEPDRARIAAINDKAKELTEPLDFIIDMTNVKSNGYQRLLEQKKKEEEEKIKQAAEALDISFEDVYIAPQSSTIRGDGAIATTKVEKRFRLVDLSQVPLEFLMLNEAKVKSSIKLGINTIPGIEIYEEKVTQLRSR